MHPGQLNPSRYGYQGEYAECEEELDQNFFQLRMYDPVVGRWNSMDPKGQYFSPYEGMGNNPINGVDPDGGNNSTHTDEQGKVLVVYNDGDNGVYAHEGATSKADIDKLHSAKNTSAGGIYMGKTLYWDEFKLIDKNTNGYIRDEGQIMFGHMWEPTIDYLHDEARGMDIIEIGNKSKSNQLLDIKTNLIYSPYGEYTGKLLGEYYFSARSAGNFLAGYNGHSAKYGSAGLQLEGYMRLAGYYNVHGELTKGQALLVLNNMHIDCGPAPYYGENPYSGRMILRGWYNKR